MSRKKTWKEIEDSRNKRLWITGVVLPLMGMGVSLYVGVPEVRKAVNDLPYKIKKKASHLKNRFHKEN